MGFASTRYQAQRRTPDEMIAHLKSFELDLNFTAGVWFFFPGGANSETITPVVATSDPMPRPLTNRMIPKPVVVVISAVMAIAMENHAYDSSMSLRLPRTSDIVPANNAPTSTPTSA